jgi:hypothetical protein
LLRVHRTNGDDDVDPGPKELFGSLPDLSRRGTILEDDVLSFEPSKM